MKPKPKQQLNGELVFRMYCNGVKIGNLSADFDRHDLIDRVNTFIEDYQGQLALWQERGMPQTFDEFNLVTADKYEPHWNQRTRSHLFTGTATAFQQSRVRVATLIPFVKQHYYFDPVLGDDISKMDSVLPETLAEKDNRVICLFQEKQTGKVGTFITNTIPIWHEMFSHFFCLPFYTYERVTNGEMLREENITDWSEAYFQQYYDDVTIDRWDIFYYIYGLLHHPGYIEESLGSLANGLPRIPFASDFWRFRAAGAKLAKLHMNYERVPRFKLHWVQTSPGAETISFRVEKMALIKPHAENGLTAERPQNETVKASYRARAAQAVDAIPRQFWHPQTPARDLMWEALRDGHMGELHFERSKRLAGAFEADFVCEAAKVAIKLEAGMYIDKTPTPNQQVAERAGYTVLRFSNNEIFNMIEDALAKIAEITDSTQIPADTDASDKAREYTTYSGLIVNDTLTLEGIPASTFDYRIGGQSVLEWIVDKYQIHEGDTSDPNHYGGTDTKYILSLVERMVHVSVETVKVIDELNDAPYTSTSLV